MAFLYDEVVEVGICSSVAISILTLQIDERITPVQSLVCPDVPVPGDDKDVVKDTATGEPVRLLRQIKEEEVNEKLDHLLSKGIKSIAIAFVHSYLWGKHEELVAKIAREKGFSVSVSSQLQPMVMMCPARCSNPY